MAIGDVVTEALGKALRLFEYFVELCLCQAVLGGHKSLKLIHMALTPAHGGLGLVEIPLDLFRRISDPHHFLLVLAE